MNIFISKSKKREIVPDLAPILWYSYGTIACLLQEIVSIYPLLSPPKLKAPASNRVCNALALLQCVASHPETRGLFLNGIMFHPFFIIVDLFSNSNQSTYSIVSLPVFEYNK